MSPSPAPIHILRCHSSQINSVYFSHDNERLYSGDLTGQVTITSTETLRTTSSWKAHNDGILGIEEWGQSIITHGRDNKLHIWEQIIEPRSLANVAAAPNLSLPILQTSLDVNALNYCRFSLLPCANASTNAMVALPNLIDSSLVDIWNIPSGDRLHAAVGLKDSGLHEDGRGPGKSGIIMSLHLFEDHSANELRLLTSYENGGVALFATANTGQKTIQGKGWRNLWMVKLHVESVMAMSVNEDNAMAFTVSADNLLCKYRLQDGLEETERAIVHRTKHPGNGAVAVQHGGRVVAVGGWDGKIRLYSTKSFKHLGTLEYHKDSCQAVTFAHQEEISSNRERWLAAGGKDGRISLFELKDFHKHQK